VFDWSVVDIDLLRIL